MGVGLDCVRLHWDMLIAPYSIVEGDMTIKALEEKYGYLVDTWSVVVNVCIHTRRGRNRGERRREGRRV